MGGASPAGDHGPCQHATEVMIRVYELGGHGGHMPPPKKIKIFEKDEKCPFYGCSIERIYSQIL